MRSPLVTQMKRTSFSGQLRRTSFTRPLSVDGHVHAARAAEDVVELQAGLADGRVVDDRQEARRVRHQGAVEQRLVLVEQPDQVDVAIEIGGLVSELLKDAPQLHVLVLDDIRQQTVKPSASRSANVNAVDLSKRQSSRRSIPRLPSGTLGARPRSHCRPYAFPTISLLTNRGIRHFRIAFSIVEKRVPVGNVARVLNAALTAAPRRAGLQRPRPCRARPRWRCQRKLATRLACSAITRALSSSGVPAGSPLINTFGLDHTGMRGQPPQLSL